MGKVSRVAVPVPQYARAARVFSWAMLTAEPEASVHLTAREKQVLFWIGEDLTTEQIAQKLDLSRKTVEFHRHALRKKLGGVAAMVRYGIKTGLLRL